MVYKGGTPVADPTGSTLGTCDDVGRLRFSPFLDIPAQVSSVFVGFVSGKTLDVIPEFLVHEGGVLGPDALVPMSPGNGVQQFMQDGVAKGFLGVPKRIDGDADEKVVLCLVPPVSPAAALSEMSVCLREFDRGADGFGNWDIELLERTDAPLEHVVEVLMGEHGRKTFFKKKGRESEEKKVVVFWTAAEHRRFPSLMFLYK